VTGADPDSLRVALLYHGDPSATGWLGESLAWELAAALRDAGHRPTLLTSHRSPTRRSFEQGISVIRSRRLPEWALRKRGIAGPLTHLPLTARALMTGHYEIAHAFTPPDALAALAWRSVRKGPVVFTWAGPVSREVLADLRLRLRLVRLATERTDAVVAPTEESRVALRRWLAIDTPTIDAGDAGGHDRLYRTLLCATPS